MFFLASRVGQYDTTLEHFFRKSKIIVSFFGLVEGVDSCLIPFKCASVDYCQRGAAETLASRSLKERV